MLFSLFSMFIKRISRISYFLDPAFYAKNEFGVELGNVLEVIKTPWVRPGVGKFYGFKVLTLVPFDLNLLDLGLLTRDDVRQKKNKKNYTNFVVDRDCG